MSGSETSICVHILFLRIIVINKKLSSKKYMLYDKEKLLNGACGIKI